MSTIRSKLPHKKDSLLTKSIHVPQHEKDHKHTFLELKCEAHYEPFPNLGVKPYAKVLTFYKISTGPTNLGNTLRNTLSPTWNSKFCLLLLL